MNIMSSQKFRLDIQGLRALAVTLVVIFHFLPAVLPGGYIGVDVFFVISGFLITAHLLREAEQSGTVKVATFWARRVRRLIPAAALVLVASAAAILLLFPVTAWRQNLEEIGFAGFYILNWKLATNAVDYFAADNPASIAQHYWSLSVEEQFYLVWPVLIILALWIAKRTQRVSRRNAIIAVLLVVFTTSLAYSVIETARSQPSAYFITPTRAWEFAVGGLIVFLPTAARLRRGVHAAMSWGAVLVIVICGFLFGPTTQFPGWIALVPVLATAALIWMGDSESEWSPQYLAKAGPIQLVGDTSYAIYLWHWPALIVFIQMRDRAPGWLSSIALGALTVLLAIATKYLVEDPMRKASRGISRPRVTFALLAGAMAVVLAVTAVPNTIVQLRSERFQESVAAGVDDDSGCFGAHAIRNSCPDPYAMTDTVNPEVTQTDSIANWIDLDHCVRWGPNLSENSCRYPGKGAGADTTVLLYGDSHAGHISPAVKRAAEVRGWEMREESRSACAGFELLKPENNSEDYQTCVKWADQMVDEIVADDSIDIVVVAVRTSTKPNPVERASEVIGDFIESGKQVLVVREAPGISDTIPASGEAEAAPACVSNAGGADDPCAWVPPAWDEWILEAAAENRVPVADLRDIVCADEVCHATIGGTIVYEDVSHFSATFSTTLAPWFGEYFDQLSEPGAVFGAG